MRVCVCVFLAVFVCVSLYVRACACVRVKVLGEAANVFPALGACCTLQQYWMRAGAAFDVRANLYVNCNLAAG